MNPAFSAFSGANPGDEEVSITAAIQGLDVGANGGLLFETLLAGITARFINLSADQVDTVIEDAQGLVCEALGLDRSTLYQFSDDGALLLTHLHQPADGPPNKKQFDPNTHLAVYWVQTDGEPSGYKPLDVRTQFPWTYERIRRGEITVLSSLDDLPEQATADRAAFVRYGTKSTVIVPLVVGGESIGCLTFAAMDRAREWSDDALRRFRFISDVFANTLARQRADESLRRRNKYIETILEQAPIGFAVHTIDDRVGRFVSARYEEIYGVPRGTITSHHDFFEKVWPNDPGLREKIRSRLLADIASGDAGRMKWENVPVVLRSGETRFITATNIPLYEQNLMVSTVQDVTERVRAETELRQTLDEVKRLHEQLHAENVYLRKEVQLLQAQTPIIGHSKALRETMLQAQQVAPTDATVLILGETGTGKGMLAQHIHAISGRSEKAFVTANIAALPATLVESELFGREKGAYTGALTKQIGRFEMADGGTLFLDEIGELPLETQVKLLRVLQSGEFERLGAGRTIRVNVRVIAATNRDLSKLIREGKFRQDLFYRLNVFPILLPPLRDRPDDIPLLVEAFVRDLSDSMGKQVERIRKKDLEVLGAYNWPGNVRELRNVVERSMILMEGTELRLIPPEHDMIGDAPASRLLRDAEKSHILQVLKSSGGKIGGSGGAAQILGLKPTTLYSMMKRLGIDRPA